VTEIENFQKLTHLNQFSRQKHTHARVWVILPQLPETCFHRIQKVAKYEWVDCANGKSAIHAWLYSKTSSVSSKQHT
jgi:hypothetical protein